MKTQITEEKEHLLHDLLKTYNRYALKQSKLDKKIDYTNRIIHKYLIDADNYGYNDVTQILNNLNERVNRLNNIKKTHVVSKRIDEVITSIKF